MSFNEQETRFFLIDPVLRVKDTTITSESRWKRPPRSNRPARKAAVVLKGLGHQFSQGGTEALETPSLWDVPEIQMAGGLAALKKIGKPVAVMHEAKGRLFGV